MGVRGKLGNNQKVLLIQLTELNNRSRWYSSQLWQIPFAYIGITGVSLASLAVTCSKILALALIIAGVLGICVLVHFSGIKDGEKRAVEHLINIEQQLKSQTAEYKPKKYIWPLKLMLIITILFYFAMGIYFLII